MFQILPFKSTDIILPISNMEYYKWKSCLSSLAIGHLKFWNFLYKEPVVLGYLIIFLQKFQNEYRQPTSQKLLAKWFW